ncbi:MAG: divalent-cation tolerance protein CutA [Candidatus Nomurabacteria bacterium]|nr:divalent-cation tolerance protein CutA [Candidatus Nomurabacteria bacterium]
MLFVYTTCSTSDEAESLSKLILENKMAACVDYWPIKSIYHWEGKLKEESEIMMIITTFESKLEAMNDLISKNHSYSVPLIAGIDVRRINRAYREWMMQEVA